MSLTKEDLVDIRTVVLEAIDVAVTPRLEALEAGQNEMRATLDAHGKMLAEHGEMLAQHGKMLAEHANKLQTLETGQKNLESAQAETNRRLSALAESLDTFSGRLEALENDVKEIYRMLSKLPISGFGTSTYSKLTKTDKLLALHQEVLHLAKLENISLPQS